MYRDMDEGVICWIGRDYFDYFMRVYFCDRDLNYKIKFYRILIDRLIAVCKGHKMKHSAKEIGRESTASPFKQASWMVTSLLRVSSGDRIENVDAFVNALEAIVFELIARNVARRLRGAAREAYKRGFAVGLYGRDSTPPECVESATLSDLDEAETHLLDKIRRAGTEHGLSVREHIVEWGEGGTGD